ncbi:MAG: Rrf2 family transcriptional regulator [Gammaproteobacteria bacterium AqS3]|nr:Rrf2 family transcriptional regulator [Gammaproteobacteria bacterium AqS3]
MRLTEKCRYAVNAVLDIAMRQHEGAVSLKAIAERQRISHAYLERVFAQLRRRGIVQAALGSRGGYSLARPAHRISVAEIVEAVDGPIDDARCSGSSCREGTICLSHQLWAGLTEQVHSYLAGINCAQLLDQRRCPVHDVNTLTTRVML